MKHTKARHAATVTGQPEEPEKLLTVQQAAAISGESKWTWRARAYKGTVASVKMSGPKSRLLIPQREVLRLQRQGTRPAVVA